MRSMWTLLLTVLSAVAAASAETCPRPLTNAECIEHSRTAANDALCSNTYYSCVGGEWTRTPVQCASGLVFNSTLGDCENSENRLCNNYCEYQLCLEDPDVGRSCEESGATQPYGGDCNRYWECSVEAGDDQTPVGSPATPQWNIQKCPMGYLYDALEGECVKVSVGGMVKCMDACRLTSVQGPTAHISDLRVECFDLFEQCVPDTKRATPVTCNEYYQCSSGGGWVKRTCNAGESFDSDTNQCVNNALGAKCLTSCECVLPSTCDTASDVARKDPYDCTKYYRCVSNGWTSHHTCPDGQQFNLNYQDAQDYCVSGNVNCEICPYNVSNFQYTTRLPHVVTTRQTTTPRFSVTTPTPLTDPPATSAPSVDDSATTLSPAGAVSALCYLPSTCVRDETPDYPVIGDCGARWHCSVRNNSWNKLNCTSGRQFDINTRDCRPISEAQCANCDGVTTPDDVVHLQTTETSGNDETTVEPEDPEDSTAQTTVAPKARQTSVPDELASTAAPTAPRTSASLTPEPSTHALTTPEQSTHAPSTVQASTRVTARVEDSTPEDTTIAQGFVQTTAAEDQTSEPSLVPSTEDLLQPDATTAPAEVSSSGASTPADAAAETSSSSADRPSTESGIIYTTPEPTTVLVYCPRTLDGEYTWPRTLAGTHATLTCVTSGVRTRGCSLGGIWGKVDMSGCVSPELYAVVNTINDAMNATEMREKTQSLRAITDATTSDDDRQQPLSVANMNATLEALYDLTDLTVTNRESPDIDVKEQIEDLAGITSDLLDPQNENTWAAMLEEEPDCGERVLQSVEDFTSVLAEYVPQGGSTNITEENIAIQVVSVDADTQNKALVLPYPVKPAPENSRGEGQGQESGEDDGEGQENWLGGMDKVELEVETIVKLKRDLKTSHIIMWTAIYRNMSFLRTPVNGTELNSKIVAFTIEKVTPDYIFDPMVRMAFMPMQPLGDLEPKCSFWDFQENSLGNWSQSGCYLIHKDDGNITCECNHLTNFAVLMAPSQKQFDKAHEVALEIISVVGCIISVVALFITIVLHTLAWSRIKSHHGAVLLNLCAVLIVANVLFLVGIDRVENETFCTVIAVALHYFFLVAFMSMLADGIMFLLYICFVLMRKTRRHTALLILMAWVVPAIIVGASYGITKGDGFGTDEMCWLALDKGLLAAFVGPVLIVILINFTILLVVLITLCNSTSAKQKTNFQKLKSTIWNIVVIMPLLGITWVFGVLAVKDAALAFTYLFCITNSLQGALIGFFHCVLNKKLREALSDRMSSSFDSSSFPQSKASRKKAVNKLAMQNKMEREVRRQQSRNSDSTISTTPRV